MKESDFYPNGQLRYQGDSDQYTISDDDELIISKMWIIYLHSLPKRLRNKILTQVLTSEKKV